MPITWSHFLSLSLSLNLSIFAYVCACVSPRLRVSLCVLLWCLKKENKFKYASLFADGIDFQIQFNFSEWMENIVKLSEKFFNFSFSNSSLRFFSWNNVSRKKQTNQNKKNKKQKTKKEMTKSIPKYSFYHKIIKINSKSMTLSCFQIKVFSVFFKK